MPRVSGFYLALLLLLPGAAGAERIKVGRRPILPVPPLILNEDTLLPARVAQSGTPLPLQECYQFAYDHQPALGSAQAKVAQAQARLGQQYALYAPSLSLELDQNFSRQSPPLLPGFPVNLLDSSTLSLQLNQTLFDFGQRRALVDAYRESLRAALFSWQGAWVQQAQKVQQAFIEQSRAEYLLAVALDNEARVASYAEVSERFYKAGIKSKIDVTQVQIQQAQAQVTVAQAQNVVGTARATLAQAMGTDVAALKSRSLRDEVFEPYTLPDHSQALQQLHHNPQVLALEAQVRFNEVSSLAQWKQLLPTVSGTASYGGQGFDVPTEVRVWTIGLTVNVPFYQPGVRPNAELFDATAAQFKKDRDSAVLGLAQQLETAYANVTGAEERSNFAAREVSIALKNFQMAYKRYSSGLSDINELINARSFLFTAQNDYVNALHDKKVAEGQLRFTQGYQPEPMIKIEGLEYAP